MRVLYHRSEKNTILTMCLFICTVIYKLALDADYANKNPISPQGFESGKFLAGFAWCIAFFFLIRHTSRKVSSFFLYLIYVVQIIPITTVYWVDNENSIYYFSVCISFALCIILVNSVVDPPIYIQTRQFSRLMTPLFAAIVLLLMIDIVTRNGAPTTLAFSFENVYELRGSGWFQIGKFFSYMLDYARSLFIPVCLTVFILNKKYFYTLIFSAIMALLYLYTGNKTIIFGLPLTLLCVFWSKRKNCYHEIFICLTLLLFILLRAYSFDPRRENPLFLPYHMMIGRTLFTPAKLKFQYYDFFCQNPHFGFYSILPSWLLPLKNPYPQTPVPNLIGMIYYKAPRMYANTGFLAEGFSHFGHVGTVLELVILSFILKQMDYFQDRAGYSCAIGFFVYSVHNLNDGSFLTSLGFGTWMLIVLVLIFYQDQAIMDANKENHMKLMYPPPNTNMY